MVLTRGIFTQKIGLDQKEAPRIKRLCQDNGVVFIASISGIGTDPSTWVPLCKDMETLGADIIELDTGGPHATFGAIAEQQDVGAPLALDPQKAYEVTKACVNAVRTPIMFKMTPQCVNAASVAKAVERAGAAAISANNSFYGTWIDHETGSFYGGPYSCGGLIGRGWQLVSLAKVLEITATVQIPVCGIGGIFTSDDVVRYLMAGASIAGLCSAIYSRGVGVIREVLDSLEAFMERKGYKSVKEFTGLCVPEFSYIRDWPREEHMATPSPVIAKFDQDKCNRCGICEKLCPYAAITVEKQTGPVVNDEYCMGCGWCVGHCPTDAITIVKAASGELIWNGRGLPVKWAIS